MKLPAPLRALMGDLVERRLWPIAVVLLVALVAVPVLIAGGGAEQTVPALPAATPADEPAGEVTPAGRTSSKAGGRTVRDPFDQPAPPLPRTSSADEPAPAPAPAAGGGAADTPAPAGGATAAGASTGSGSYAAGDSAPVNVPGLDDVGVVPVGGSAPSGTTVPADTDTQDTGTTPAGLDSWQVDVRFGPEGDLRPRTDLARLTPLPDATDPFFVFLGVLADGRTALFLIASDATATGEGTCSPSPEQCDRVELQEGQTETFQVATPQGEVVRYQLELTNVARRLADTPDEAQFARTRESAPGRQVLRTAVSTGQVDVSDLAYSSRLGLVVPSGKADQDGGTLFGGFRVDLRFGAPGALVKRYNLARLTPLPSVESPSFLFLGVLGDGRTALFLNPSESHARGDAVCEPSPEECQRVKLAAGQSAVFDTPTINGATTEHQLDVDAIAKVKAATPAEATASRHRESPAGRVVLRRLITEVGGLVADLSFSGSKGSLEQVPTKP